MRNRNTKIGSNLTRTPRKEKREKEEKNTRADKLQISRGNYNETPLLKPDYIKKSKSTEVLVTPGLLWQVLME